MPLAAQKTPPATFADRLLAWISRCLQQLALRPVLFQFGNRIVMGYGVFLSTGFGLGILYGLSLLTFRFQAAPPPGWAILGLAPAAFAGSKLLFFAERELARWLDQAAINMRGHTLYGGILGSLVYWIFLYRSDPGSLLLFSDCAAPAIALGYAVGKLGCLSFGCCVGRPTRSRLNVRYQAEISKAVGFYELIDIPLAPVQLYESAFGLALFALLSLQPSLAFGTGQVMGLFLLLFGLGRMFLLRLRYRFLDERAGVMVSMALNLILILVSLSFLSGLSARFLELTSIDKVSAQQASFGWAILASAVVVALTLWLFGVHQLEAEN